MPRHQLAMKTNGHLLSNASHIRIFVQRLERWSMKNHGQSCLGQAGSSSHNNAKKRRLTRHHLEISHGRVRGSLKLISSLLADCLLSGISASSAVVFNGSVHLCRGFVAYRGKQTTSLGSLLLTAKWSSRVLANQMGLL